MKKGGKGNNLLGPVQLPSMLSVFLRTTSRYHDAGGIYHTIIGAERGSPTQPNHEGT